MGARGAGATGVAAGADPPNIKLPPPVVPIVSAMAVPETLKTIVKKILAFTLQLPLGSIGTVYSKGRARAGAIVREKFANG